MMHEAHDALAGVDLNLVLALDALLAERHVTRAAGRLGITQSAASHALARLRDLFGDPLLVRGPRGAMIPTPRAEALAPQVHRVLGELAGVLRGEGFDPATARRVFRIGAGDYAEVVLLPKLIERVSRLAPGIELWVHPFGEHGDAELAAGTLDVVLAPPRGGARGAGGYEKVLFGDASPASCGRMLALAEQTAGLLRASGVSDLKFRADPRGQHRESDWRRRLLPALRFHFGKSR